MEAKTIMIKIHKKMQIGVFACAAVLGAAAAFIPLYLNNNVAEKTIKLIDYEREIMNLQATAINKASPFKAAALATAAKETLLPPTPPSVPAMPTGPKGINNIIHQDKLTVVGLLPPNIAIIQKSGKAITVKSGQKSEYGYIGEITSNGVYIDGIFMKIEF